MMAYFWVVVYSYFVELREEEQAQGIRSAQRILNSGSSTGEIEGKYP